MEFEITSILLHQSIEHFLYFKLEIKEMKDKQNTHEPYNKVLKLDKDLFN